MQNFTIATWNILFDKGGEAYGAAPQIERRDDIIQTLTTLDPHPSVVGLLEIDNVAQSHHIGKTIARSLMDTDGFWVSHGSRGEDMGMFGIDIESFSVHDLTQNRKIVIGHFRDVAIGLIHFSYNLSSDRIRNEQTRVALDIMEKYDRAIVMGDFNSTSWQGSRKTLKKANFQSVFECLGRKRPPTVVTEKYRQCLPLHYKLGTVCGFSPDDIYVRGVDIEDAGIFEGDSDHRGVWATISTSK